MITAEKTEKKQKLTFRKTPSPHLIFGLITILFLLVFPLNGCEEVDILLVGESDKPQVAITEDPEPDIPEDLQSDINKDKRITFLDLREFSSHYLEADWQDNDWCAWIETDTVYKDKILELVEYASEFFGCDPESADPLTIKNARRFPTRLAIGSDGKLYVSDARIGSVFIYETMDASTLVGELKLLHKPLGIAVDQDGNIYVGSNDADIILVFSPLGHNILSFGSGLLEMPNYLTFDPDGNLYVTDSRKRQVLKFDPATGEYLGNIGEGQLAFPVSSTIHDGYIYVSDQGGNIIKVFDMDGNFYRSYGGLVTENEKKRMGYGGGSDYDTDAKYLMLQAVAIDSNGDLHTLDSRWAYVQKLDPATGGYIGEYFSKGSGPGKLTLPLDIIINDADQTIVADSGNNKIEIH